MVATASKDSSFLQFCRLDACSGTYRSTIHYRTVECCCWTRWWTAGWRCSTAVRLSASIQDAIRPTFAVLRIPSTGKTHGSIRKRWHTRVCVDVLRKTVLIDTCDFTAAEQRIERWRLLRLNLAVAPTRCLEAPRYAVKTATWMSIGHNLNETVVK